MDNFFGKFRSGAGKAAFEADKLRRVTAVQNTVRSLKSNYEKGLYQVGKVAFSLHQDQQISQPALLEICERQAAVLAQITAREKEIEEIRAETFVEDMSFGQAQYGRLCPNGHGAIPPQDNYCQKCGAKAIEVPPPTGQQCTNCGASLAADARFCASCGQTAPSAPLPENACPSCHAPLLADALFCAECGHRVVKAELTPEPEVAIPVEDWAATIQTETSDDAVVSTVAEEDSDNEHTEILVEDELIEETAVSETICPSCQSELLPGAMFCAECGYRLTA
ncbi:MAG: zinc ribbon domain-containing protein [Anaerolineae bacterium]|nr:zinc ribbon domain-containing protein [Anaerolineae bacterium]